MCGKAAGGSENWSTWKFQMEPLLKAKGLWSFTQGPLNKDSDEETLKKSERAFSTIALSISTARV